MLYLSLGAIAFVAILKTITHLHPYVGMMLSLGVVAIFAELYRRSKYSVSDYNATPDEFQGHHSPVHASLSKI